MLRQRVFTACFLALFLAVVLLWLPFGGFVLAVTLVASLAAWEWSGLAGLSEPAQRLAYACAVALLLALLFVAGFHLQRFAIIFVLALSLAGWGAAACLLVQYPDRSSRWYRPRILLPAGLWLLVPVWTGLLVLQPRAPHGGLVWLVIALIAAADIGAYFAGRRFGQRKLAAHISPGKTWAGFWGGLAAAMLLAVAISSTFAPIMPALVPVAALVAVASVGGDLFESMVKRERGIKDSSQLLPGHGGVLDRIDGWTAAVPVFALLHLLLVAQ